MGSDVGDAVGEAVGPSVGSGVGGDSVGLSVGPWNRRNRISNLPWLETPKPWTKT